MNFKLLIFLSLISDVALANGPKAQEDYIEKYKDAAIREMKEYGIPASITLAQGLLESGSGNSYLAVEGNNHFGIKCHLDWDGPKLYKDDDRKNECFRAYRNPEESFRDHSLFLRNRSRYAFLFEEDPTDYEAWAKGLKKAGYATNRKYDDHLIELIERYKLYRYDQVEGFASAEQNDPLEEVSPVYEVRVSPNRVDYVVAGEGDSFESIAKALDKRIGEILKYNELTYDTKLKAGQILYLQPKRRRASRGNEEYVVKEGDTMYSIAQKFAIRLEKLYKRNDMQVGEQPKPGDKLELR